MLIYAIIMFLVAGLFAWLGVAIYRGKTDLIHSYHQTKVADKAAYGKAFGKALFVFAAAMLLSGILALLGSPDAVEGLVVAVLLIGIVIGTAYIVVVQKKHNGGVF